MEMKVLKRGSPIIVRAIFCSDLGVFNPKYMESFIIIGVYYLPVRCIFIVGILFAMRMTDGDCVFPEHFPWWTLMHICIDCGNRIIDLFKSFSISSRIEKDQLAPVD